LLKQFTSDGLEFEDGSQIKADVVIFATGFSTNMKNEVQKLFSKEIADKMGDCWGLDSEGEVKGAYRPGGRKLSLLSELFLCSYVQ